MLFKCLPPGTEPLAGRFPGPVHARGKWFTIDIHCHVRSDKAAAMVENNSDVSRWFLETSANARSAAASKLLDDDDFTAGLTKLIRKTVRDYCSVGKKDHIDC